PYVFFFQAEDGIRVFHVTGVQTCALPIWAGKSRISPPAPAAAGHQELFVLAGEITEQPFVTRFIQKNHGPRRDTDYQVAAVLSCPVVFTPVGAGLRLETPLVP